MLHCNLAVFFFNDPSPTYIYTLSLHDALPILPAAAASLSAHGDARRLDDRPLVGVEAPLAAHRRDAHRRSEEHTSELQSPDHLVCRLLLEKKNSIVKLVSMHTILTEAPQSTSL